MALDIASFDACLKRVYGYRCWRCSLRKRDLRYLRKFPGGLLRLRAYRDDRCLCSWCVGLDLVRRKVVFGGA